MSVQDLTLASGLAGQLLITAATGGARGVKSSIEEMIDEMQNKVRDYILPPGLFSGLAGVDYAINEGLKALQASRDERISYHSEVVKFYLDYLDTESSRSEYDVISGLAGIGLWACTLDDKENGSKIADKILKALDETKCDLLHARVAWETPVRREIVSGKKQREAKDDYNLGLAHGVPGVLLFISLAFGKGLFSDKKLAKDLIDGIVHFLADQMNDEGEKGIGIFGHSTYNRDISRMAWCYGDPGVAVAISVAHEYLPSDITKNIVLRLTESISNRTFMESGCIDGGICHGTTGVLMIVKWLRMLHESLISLKCVATWAEYLNLHESHTWYKPSRLIWELSVGDWVSTPGYLNGVDGIRALKIVNSNTECWNWAIARPLGLFDLAESENV
ncbi:MAG: hypothetical protein CMP06_05870 [Xanthomonadales bacterium]|nr:hypothetical protein [Xanthomonadales bacterium]